MDQKVYAFSEGNRSMSDLLGGKGANLAEMASLGIPVPDGFAITTEVCQEHLRTGGLGSAPRGWTRGGKSPFNHGKYLRKIK
jgi:phosphoenolpyruvate synthase/pyruvate phosphate dikinase